MLSSWRLERGSLVVVGAAEVRVVRRRRERERMEVMEGIFAKGRV